MKICKIITLANKAVKLRFLAMERSLRATGCQLPLLVIPYDDNLFELPDGSTWWEVPEITNWLKANNAHPVMRKYQCFTTENYQFVDSDICFLRNPEAVLEPYEGFITSCGHWRDPSHTLTPDSHRWITQRSTVWQQQVFNTGQFACDRVLYTPDHLIKTAMDPQFSGTCVHWIHNEQPGLNWLIWLSKVQITNLTLPSLSMESTWAGDYPGHYEQYWADPERKPYLIHWAGTGMDIPRPINQIFYDFLTPEEKIEWDAQVRNWSQKKKNPGLNLSQRIKRSITALVSP